MKLERGSELRANGVKRMNTTAIGNSLKLFAIFRSKGLLPTPIYLYLKDVLLCDYQCLDAELNSLCLRYDVDALSDSRNLDTLLALHDELERFAHLAMKRSLGQLYNDGSLSRAHQGASGGSLELSSVYPPQNEYDPRCFIYGEIEFDSFTHILNMATNNMSHRRKFVDLGSGAAKAVLWASLVKSFEILVGIEINPKLHIMSLGILECFHRKMRSSIYVTPLARTGEPNIELVLGSFLDLKVHDWTDADVVFANSASYSDGLMKSLSKCSADMRAGSRLITLTQGLTDNARWKIIYKERAAMSWGAATVFVHERL